MSGAESLRQSGKNALESWTACRFDTTERCFRPMVTGQSYSFDANPRRRTNQEPASTISRCGSRSIVKGRIEHRDVAPQTTPWLPVAIARSVFQCEVRTCPPRVLKEYISGPRAPWGVSTLTDLAIVSE